MDVEVEHKFDKCKLNTKCVPFGVKNLLSHSPMAEIPSHGQEE